MQSGANVLNPQFKNTIFLAQSAPSDLSQRYLSQRYLSHRYLSQRYLSQQCLSQRYLSQQCLLHPFPLCCHLHCRWGSERMDQSSRSKGMRVVQFSHWLRVVQFSLWLRVVKFSLWLGAVIWWGVHWPTSSTPHSAAWLNATPPWCVCAALLRAMLGVLVCTCACVCVCVFACVCVWIRVVCACNLCPS